MRMILIRNGADFTMRGNFVSTILLQFFVTSLIWQVFCYSNNRANNFGMVFALATFMPSPLNASHSQMQMRLIRKCKCVSFVNANASHSRSQMQMRLIRKCKCVSFSPRMRMILIQTEPFGSLTLTEPVGSARGAQLRKSN